GADLAVFLLSDGKLSAKPKPARVFTLTELQALYAGAQAASLEQNTLDTVETHLKHLKGTLGARFAVGGLATSDLQAHIDRRSKDTGRRGKPLSPSTIKKEHSECAGSSKRDSSPHNCSTIMVVSQHLCDKGDDHGEAQIQA